MNISLFSLTAAALLAGSVSWAQDTTTPNPAAPTTAQPETTPPVDGLSMGEEVADPNAPGTKYARAQEGDWDIICVRVPEGQIEPCNLYQLLRDAQGNSVAEISIFALPAGQQAAAGAQIVTPLETLLTAQLTLKVDAAAGKRYPYTFCARIGCFAQIGFTEADVNAFRRGNKATLTIVPVGAPKDVTVDLDVSLKGFTAGFKAVQEIADAAEAAAKN